MGTKQEEEGANYNVNKRNIINVASEQFYANAGLEKGNGKKDNSADSCKNTGNSFNSNNRPHKTSLLTVKDNTVGYLLSGMTDNKPITKETNNEIEYFIPGPNKENDKRVSTKISKQIQKEFEEVFIGIGCFEGMLSLQVKLEVNHTRCLTMCGICTTKTIWRRIRETSKTGHHSTIWHGWDGKVVQQPKAK